MASKVGIKKCNDVDLPIDTSNDIYRLKTVPELGKKIIIYVIPKDLIFMSKCMKIREYHSKS